MASVAKENTWKNHEVTDLGYFDVIAIGHRVQIDN
jgi:hypothetical protein